MTSEAPSAPSPRVRATSLYTELAQTIRTSGLMTRRYGYYWTRFGLAVGALAAVWVAVVLLGNSWLTLICAAVLGLVLAQFGFLGHDAAHRQVFTSAAWNDWASRLMSGAFIGLSYGWWRTKHTLHHKAPNQQGADPDIAPGVLAFSPDEAAVRTRGVPGWAVRRQGWLLFPLLALEGLSLHVDSARALWSRRTIAFRRTELALIVVRLAVYVTTLLLILPPGKAAAFVGVQVAVFGIALGGAFVPNHTGMPIIPKDLTLDFLRRQVLMSRNIRSTRGVPFLMGGLQFQIEHHLFPSMPRPNLAHARPVVRAYCLRHSIDYTETTLAAAYVAVVRHLNHVGMRNHDAFACPFVATFRA